MLESCGSSGHCRVLQDSMMPTSSAAAPTPGVSEKRLDMDDADYGGDAVDLPDGGIEQENEEALRLVQM
jgi:hypothetical protein